MLCNGRKCWSEPRAKPNGRLATLNAVQPAKWWPRTITDRLRNLVFLLHKGLMAEVVATKDAIEVAVVVVNALKIQVRQVSLPNRMLRDQLRVLPKHRQDPMSQATTVRHADDGAEVVAVEIATAEQKAINRHLKGRVRRPLRKTMIPHIRATTVRTNHSMHRVVIPLREPMVQAIKRVMHAGVGAAAVAIEEVAPTRKAKAVRKQVDRNETQIRVLVAEVIPTARPNHLPHRQHLMPPLVMAPNPRACFVRSMGQPCGD